MFSRNGGTLHAFVVGDNAQSDVENMHFKIIGTHTDSPMLKIAPRSRRVDTRAGFEQINVQVYGGGLW